MSHPNSEGVCVIIEDSDLTDDEPGPSRSVFRPSACSAEAAWFNQPFHRPFEEVINSDIPQECLTKFQDLIWNKPHDRMVPGYGLTPKELASVSSDGRKGWLVTSHFYWLSRCLNQQQKSTRFFVFDPAIRRASVDKLLGGKCIHDVKQLIFVLSVGRQDDGVVFLGSDTMQGDHWSVAVVDVLSGTVSYCDTLGWPAPENLLTSIIKYTYILGLTQTRQLSVRMAHKPNYEQHQCTSECTNYPLQKCSDVCGVVAMVCIATAALDHNLFEILLTPINKDLNLYLTDPTLYSSYLRHVLIYWLITGCIDISRISLKPGFSPLASGSKDIPNLKRKLESDCNGDNNHGPRRRVRNCLPHRSDITVNEYILEALETGISSEDFLSEVTSLFTVLNESQNSSSDNLRSCITNLSLNNAIERSKDDALSTKAYCKDLVQFPNCNPVILFKNYGKLMKTLSPEDVLLAIQTPFQKEMMKTYGKTCICVDTARKTEDDTLYLVTVLVCFEGSLDLPVAWLITNRTDCQVLNLFVKTLNLNVEGLQTEVFLGDINLKMYKIWTQHFPKPSKVMYNSWEVLQVLNNKVETLIPGVTERNQIKYFLSILLAVTDVKAFKGYLQAFLDIVKPFESFFSYFTAKFVQNGKDELWASCYRQVEGSKLVPFLKPHSQILKEFGIYGQQKMNRLDVIMHKLLQLIRFLENKLYIQPSPTLLEKAVKKIERQHDCPIDNLDIFQSASGEEWHIRASTDTNAFSIIDSGYTDCSCELRCKICNVCIHRYVCTCCDYLVLASSCKHIHMVNTYKKMNNVLSNSNVLASPTGSVEPCVAGNTNSNTDVNILQAETQQILAHLLHTIPAIKDSRKLQQINTTIQTYLPK